MLATQIATSYLKVPEVYDVIENNYIHNRGPVNMIEEDRLRLLDLMPIKRGRKIVVWVA